MQLPKAPEQYDGGDQAQLRGILEREDKRNLKTGFVFNEILIRDSASGIVRTLTVASGALIIT